jgi:hypothetical protein
VAFLAVVVSNGLHRPFTEPSGGREAYLLLELVPTFRAVLHNGLYSLHFNARPAPGNDAFGVVDLTFGPGRILRFVSSAKHLESGRLINLDMAGDAGSDLALIGRMEGALRRLAWRSQREIGEALTGTASRRALRRKESTSKKRRRGSKSPR